jgi:malonate decarboxylase gamma subunit
MNVATLLDSLFPAGHTVVQQGDFIAGNGTVGEEIVAVVGSANAAAIGVELALSLAGEVLRVVREHSGRPILVLVDTQGQRLRHRDELLGINSYMAHLAKSLELARRLGHRVISLVYGRAVSGGYITGGMMADVCCALPSAEISVMNLPAMARVTKIAQERLEALAQTSPVFAPGADNYWKMGALQSLWQGDLAEALRVALQSADGEDRRRELGAARGGRTMAAAVAKRVRSDVIE